jgi:hypothetical protein
MIIVFGIKIFNLFIKKRVEKLIILMFIKFLKLIKKIWRLNFLLKFFF